MQVVRESHFGDEYSGERVRNAWTTYLREWDNTGKLVLIPQDVAGLLAGN